MTIVTRSKRVRVDQIAMLEGSYLRPYVLLTSGEEVKIDSMELVESVKAALDNWTVASGFQDAHLWEFVTRSRQVRMDQIATFDDSSHRAYITLLSGKRQGVDQDRIEPLTDQLNHWLNWNSQPAHH